MSLVGILNGCGNINTDMEGKHVFIATEILLGMKMKRPDNQIDIMSLFKYTGECKLIIKMPSQSP